MLVGVVGGVRFQMLVEHSVDLVVVAKCHRRVRLQRYAELQSVEIYSGDKGHLGLVVRFRADNGGKG